mmetsp:Transcript_11279/g.25690  ORF Transcript_11279/g.25690 Transcript_11279/m.25690 type:complete len:407 (-) Transcript_11279:13-1233(-)
MILLPLGKEETSSKADSEWHHQPGYPKIRGTSLHPPVAGGRLPEFVYEGDTSQCDAAPVFYLGSGSHCHIQVDAALGVAERSCRIWKELQAWFIEAVYQPSLSTGVGIVHHGTSRLEVGCFVQLNDDDVIHLSTPPTRLGFRIQLRTVSTSVPASHFTNRYPNKPPLPSSASKAPPAPEALRRLAWQTDQMRKRSEENMVHVSDWSSFSQYVKKYYFEHGITCISWEEEGRKKPIDAPLPLLQPAAYPSWITELLLQEEPVAGVDRPLPCAASLRLSGMLPAERLTRQAAKPQQPPLAAATPSFCMPSNGGCTDGVGSAMAQKPNLQSPVKNRHLQLPFKDWLQAMDSSNFLMQYHDTLVANYDSLEQVHDLYVKHGAIESAFFDDVRVVKLGHRRIMEKWFRDHC